MTRNDAIYLAGTFAAAVLIMAGMLLDRTGTATAGVILLFVFILVGEVLP